MTKDHDRKALIRERMEKTGESYTTARMHVLGGGDPVDPNAAAPTPRTSFAMPNDGPAKAVRRELNEGLDKIYEAAGVEIRGDQLAVWMGDPPLFSATIPLSSIASAERLPDRGPGSSLGVHGGRGRWLVNSAYTGLVRLTISPAATAAMAPARALPAAARDKSPRIVRFLMRERTVKLKQLTVSVDDADALVGALR